MPSCKANMPSLIILNQDENLTKEFVPNKGEKLDMMMEKIRNKANQLKPLPESAKAIRAAMMDKRLVFDSNEKALMQKFMDTLQKSMKIVSLQGMLERLETLSRQLGLKFHPESPGTDCYYISADSYYVEVAIYATGGVKDVHVQHSSESAPKCVPEMRNALNRADFQDFISHLEGLNAIYQLNTDIKTKGKAWIALSSLERDLGALAEMQMALTPDPHSLIHDSPVGVLQPRQGGHPMLLTYFISPYELLDKKAGVALPLTVEMVTSSKKGRYVAVVLQPATPNKLQVMSVLNTNRTGDGHTLPSFMPLNNMNSATLPAIFALQLPKALPVSVPTLHHISQITGVEVGDTDNVQPLMNLITSDVSNGELECGFNKGLFVTLPDQQHCYFMMGIEELQGIMLKSIRFTHPTHVPQILVLLRKQALFNALIASCVRTSSKQELEGSITFEVSASSVHQISVTFEHPLEQCMATAELDLSYISNIKCRLHSLASNQILCSEEYASKILQRCLSIPVTMRAIIKKAQSTQPKAAGQSEGEAMLTMGRAAFLDQNSSAHFPPNLDSKRSQKADHYSSSARGKQEESMTGQSAEGAEPYKDVTIGLSGSSTLGPRSQGPHPSTFNSTPFIGPEGFKKAKSAPRKRKMTSESAPGSSPHTVNRFSPKQSRVGDEDEFLTSVSTPMSAPPTLGVGGPELSSLKSSSSMEDLRKHIKTEPYDFDLEDMGVPDGPTKHMDKSKRKLKKVKSDSKLSAAHAPSLMETDAPSMLLHHLSEKSSLSITPISSSPATVCSAGSLSSSTTVSSASSSINSTLARFGLERRPGIEIIPISSAPNPYIDDKRNKSREFRKETPEKKKGEKKEKRKRRGDEDLSRREVMGPPRSGATKPITLSIKTSPGSLSYKKSSELGRVKLGSANANPANSLLTANSSVSASGSALLYKASTLSPKQGFGSKHGSSPKQSSASPKMSSPKQSASLKSLSSLQSSAPGGKPTLTPLAICLGNASAPSIASLPKIPKIKDRKPPISVGGDGKSEVSTGTDNQKIIGNQNFGAQAMMHQALPGKNLQKKGKGSLSAVIDKLRSTAEHTDTSVSPSGTEKKDAPKTEFTVKPSSKGLKLTVTKTKGSDGSGKSYSSTKSKMHRTMGDGSTQGQTGSPLSVRQGAQTPHGKKDQIPPSPHILGRSVQKSPSEASIKNIPRVISPKSQNVLKEKVKDAQLSASGKEAKLLGRQRSFDECHTQVNQDDALQLIMSGRDLEFLQMHSNEGKVNLSQSVSVDSLMACDPVAGSSEARSSVSKPEKALPLNLTMSKEKALEESTKTSEKNADGSSCLPSPDEGALVIDDPSNGKGRSCGNDMLLPEIPPAPSRPLPSPSVSAHIVTSPACGNSPITLISPHSSKGSPCAIDDELMNEALLLNPQ
ncbi:unnamed protein product [Darwinula stevensoni]|uniref:Mediator of RNA polymerase II transcription subunit 1 n=1 Tax=Darwinula stevensoni TaxID=69355 RepID=A0A7R8X2R9_9CRUS|nr:unnamed protein product [Darwinula stevensoni]CAG0881757.1 unnamed protein product [Darwinula stevensoni]